MKRFCVDWRLHASNNESERMMRKVAMARKIRFGMASRTGARMSSSIMNRMLTWRKRNLNVLNLLLKALKVTWPVTGRVCRVTQT